MAVQRISLSLSIKGAGADSEEYASIFDPKSVFSMDLKEAVSGPYEALLRVFTKKPLKRKLLKELPGKKVVISASCGDDLKTVKRCVEGTVCCCTYFGKLIPSKTDGHQNCSYQYEIKVVSPFEGMKLATRSRSFDNQSPVLVIRDIVESYGLKLYTDEKLLDSKYFDKTLIYEQINESDYDFIHKLMVMYGINYVFVHDNDTGNPAVYLSRAAGATLYRGSSVVIESLKDGSSANSDHNTEKPFNTDVSKIVSCSLYGTDSADVLNLNTLKCSSVNGYSNKTNSELEKILPEVKPYFMASKMLYNAARTREQRRVNENLQARLMRDTPVYHGQVSSLEPYQGRIVSLVDFYDDETIYALITSSSVYVEQSAPEDRAFTIVGNSTVRTTFDALELAALTDGSINGSITGEIKTSDEFGNSINLGSFAEYDFEHIRENSGSEFVEAVVSDGAGNTSGGVLGSICIYADDNTEDPSMFYAVTESSTLPLVATVTYTTQRGAKGSISKFPRIGQRVLLCRKQGRFYLQGYLPDTDSLYVFDNNSRSLKLGSDTSYYNSPVSKTIWSRNDKKADNLQEPSAPPCGDVERKIGQASISMENIGNEKDFILAKIYRRQINHFFESLTNSKNDRSYLDRFTSVLDGESSSYSDQCQVVLKDLLSKESELKKSAKAYYDYLGTLDGTVASFDVTQDIDAYESGKEATLDKLAAEYKEKKSAYLDSCDTMNSLADKIISNTGIHSEEGEDPVISPETMNIIAEGFSVDAESGDITFNAGAEITIKAGKAINLEAPTIKLVGENLINAAINGNAISISKNAVSAKSKKWTTGKGIFDAGITMDSVSGTVITGMSVNIGGALSASISDNLGANISASYGVANITGNSTVVSSRLRREFIKNASQSLFSFVDEIIDMGLTLSEHKNGTKWTKPISYAIPTAIGSVSSVVQAYYGIKNAQGTANKIIAVISNTAKIVSTFYDMVLQILISTEAEFLSKNIGDAEKITWQDALRLFGLLLKLFVMGATVVPYAVAMSGSLKCSLSMQGKTLSLEAGAVKEHSKEMVNAISPTAGKDLETKDDDNENVENDKQDDENKENEEKKNENEIENKEDDKKDENKEQNEKVEETKEEQKKDDSQSKVNEKDDTKSENLKEDHKTEDKQTVNDLSKKLENQEQKEMDALVKGNN